VNPAVGERLNFGSRMAQFGLGTVSVDSGCKEHVDEGCPDGETGVGHGDDVAGASVVGCAAIEFVDDDVRGLATTTHAR